MGCKEEDVWRKVSKISVLVTVFVVVDWRQWTLVTGLRAPKVNETNEESGNETSELWNTGTVAGNISLWEDKRAVS